MKIALVISLFAAAAVASPAVDMGARGDCAKPGQMCLGIPCCGGLRCVVRLVPSRHRGQI